MEGSSEAERSDNLPDGIMRGKVSGQVMIKFLFLVGSRKTVGPREKIQDTGMMRHRFTVKSHLCTVTAQGPRLDK